LKYSFTVNSICEILSGRSLNQKRTLIFFETIFIQMVSTVLIKIKIERIFILSIKNAEIWKSCY